MADDKAESVLAVCRDLDGKPEVDLPLEALFLDTAASDGVRLFSYSWRGPVVVLGYGQKNDDVDFSWCRSHGVGVYRRLTGGTGVVHRRDLAVSLFLPAGHPWASRIRDLYARFLGVLAPVLNHLGGRGHRPETVHRGGRWRSPICFEDHLADTLVADSRKVVGCAQARRGGAVLIHAAVSLNLDTVTYAGVFGVEKERIARGLGDAVPGGEPGQVAAAVEEAMAAALGLAPAVLTLPDIKGGGDLRGPRGGWIVAPDERE